MAKCKYRPVSCIYKTLISKMKVWYAKTCLVNLLLGVHASRGENWYRPCFRIANCTVINADVRLFCLWTGRVRCCFSFSYLFSFSWRLMVYYYFSVSDSLRSVLSRLNIKPIFNLVVFKIDTISILFFYLFVRSIRWNERYTVVYVTLNVTF